MGNASTKERASSPGDGGSGPSTTGGGGGGGAGGAVRRSGRSNGEPSSGSSSSHPLGRLGVLADGGPGSDGGYMSRSARRHNFENAIFGLGSGSGGGGSREARERDREAEKAAREARRKEREEERQRERDRSRREESLDGGFLVTHGVYTSSEDFKDKVVRQLMIERRLAPFWKGLRDHHGAWTDAQLYAAFHDQPLPGPDAEPPSDVEPVTRAAVGSSDSLTVPIASRSRAQSYASEGSARSNTSTPSFGFSSSRSRAKTLSISSPKNPTLAPVAGPAETYNRSRFIDGRPIEAVLYQHAVECPICFLYYPPYLNRTRCCDQEICSECFVQIKRADPHIPESHDHHPHDHHPPPPTSLPPPGQPRHDHDRNHDHDHDQDHDHDHDHGRHGHDRHDHQGSVADQLVSEPATCPFCKQTDFGVTYLPPPWRRGISYLSPPTATATAAATATSPSPFSIGSNLSSTSLSAASCSGSQGGGGASSPPVSPSWKRRTMLPLTAPEVVTSDDIRPDWSTKLQTARQHAARRAAAATALHAAAFLMNTNASPSPSSSGPAGYGRRLIRRAVRDSSSSAVRDNAGNGGGSESPSPSRSGSRTPSHPLNHPDAAGRTRSQLAHGGGGGGGAEARAPTVEERLANLGFISPASGGAGPMLSRADRRSRIVDLEEMMLMEAIRLSLAEEEERKARQQQQEQQEQQEQQQHQQEQQEQQEQAEADAAEEQRKDKGKDVDRPSAVASGSGGGGSDGLGFSRLVDGGKADSVVEVEAVSNASAR